MQVSKISVVDAGTFNYKEQLKITTAIWRALELIDIPSCYFKPDMKVLIKPNLVMDDNQNKRGGNDCLYTQPEIVKAVIDFVLLKTSGKVKITVGDAPMQECKFNNFYSYWKMVDEYKNKGVDIQLVDFRELKAIVVGGVHVAEVKKNAYGSIINLGSDSEFFGIDNNTAQKLRITNYDPSILPLHHKGDIQEYYISNYVLDADLIFNLPKPKSHRKAGATISLKNLVGINTRKEFLPHHTQGSLQEGGDEYPEKNRIKAIQSKLFDKKNFYEAQKKYMLARIIRGEIKILSLFLRKGRASYFEGSWFGNHTISRTIADLNKIVFYADKNGKICNQKQRHMIILGDMIVSGEKEGPVFPSPKNVGLIIGGLNPVCFDEVVSTIMGYDYHKIPTIVNARELTSKLKIVEKDVFPIIVSDRDEWNNILLKNIPDSLIFHFEPSSGWKNHIEVER